MCQRLQAFLVYPGREHILPFPQHREVISLCCLYTACHRVGIFFLPNHAADGAPCAHSAVHLLSQTRNEP